MEDSSMNAEIKNGKLIITIDTNKKPVPSASGKTLVVASSHGNQPTGCLVDGKPVVIGVNAYIKK
jgi:hypothetical protein